MKLRRLESIPFETATGFVARVLPLTRGQMRALYALEAVDAAAAVAPLDASELRGRRMEIIMERSLCTDAAGQGISEKMFREMLTAEEEIDIINGMIAHHNGIDVRYAVDLQAAIRDALKKKNTAEASPEKSS